MTTRFETQYPIVILFSPGSELLRYYNGSTQYLLRESHLPLERSTLSKAHVHFHISSIIDQVPQIPHKMDFAMARLSRYSRRDDWSVVMRLNQASMHCASQSWRAAWHSMHSTSLSRPHPLKGRQRFHIFDSLPVCSSAIMRSDSYADLVDP
jgi:hypothetical protein